MKSKDTLAKMKSLILVLLLWSVYGCNNWKLTGEAVDGENDLTSYITTILNELYVANFRSQGMFNGLLRRAPH